MKNLDLVLNTVCKLTSFHCGQCPIGPQSSFKYRFTAEPAGTFFYHSHVPYQMGDGVFGAFIVQDPDNDPYYADGQLIAQDVVIGLSDWMRYTSDTVYQFVSQFRVDIWPLSHYISFLNGQQDFSFVVQPGATYRLRIYCATVEFGYRLFFTGGHRMTVIAADGGLVQPVETDYLDIYSGERYDVLLAADQEVGTYQLLANVLTFTGKLKKEVIYGNMVYKGAVVDTSNTQARVTDTADRLAAFRNVDPALTLLDSNRLTAYRDIATDKFHDDYQPVPGPAELMPDPWVYKTTSYAVVHEPQFKFMDAWDNHFHHASFRNSTPLLFLGENDALATFASQESRTITVTAYSNESQTHSATLGPRLEFLELDETIDIIFENAAANDADLGLFDAYHPMHIHGHSVWAVAVGEGKFDAHMATAKANFVDPPMRDNVVVPPSSWVWVRLRASNPGLWLMHCHTETHAVFGMMTVWVVGEAADRPLPPADFAVCGTAGRGWRKSPHFRSWLGLLLLASVLVAILSASLLFRLWHQRRRARFLPYHRVQMKRSGRRTCGSRERRDS